MNKLVKNKQNGKVGLADNCATPDYAVTPLLQYIHSRFITPVIYESAAGEGYINNYLINYFTVIMGDIITGNNYFEREIINYDVEITNPPFSLKYNWLTEAYSRNKPFCLLLPVETIGAEKAQRLFDKYGVQIMYMSRRVDFKMPHKKWCWIEDNPKSKRYGKLVHSSSQFPTAWFTWNMGLSKDIMFCDISENKRKWRKEKELEFRTGVLL